MKRILFIVISSAFLFNGCSSGVRFFACPHEAIEEMKLEKDIGQRRELLWRLKYSVLVVHKASSNEILPVNHFRPEHTFGYRIHPIEATYEKPLTMGTLIIIKRISEPIGIGIKKLSDMDWRVYWLKKTDIAEVKRNGVVYLPPYNSLPLIINEEQ